MTQDLMRDTELRNVLSRDLDTKTPEEILSIINAEDMRVPEAVRREIPQIARAVKTIAHSIRAGGKLIYAGAGTSGRIAAVDAAECPPTYGVSPELVQAVIAGGPEAMSRPVERAEDSEEDGYADLLKRHPKPGDVVVGVSASGRTPYTLGCLRAGRDVHCHTVAVVCSPSSPMESVADITICPIVGPEVVAGSTRMKAGTAQKLVLNMISTTVMVLLGRVYDNLMVDVVPTNDKLIERARRIVEEVCCVSADEAQVLLDAAGNNVKAAIIMGRTGTTRDGALSALTAAGGNLRQALAALAPRGN